MKHNTYGILSALFAIVTVALIVSGHQIPAAVFAICTGIFGWAAGKGEQ
jgi:hypothetical protein